MKIVLVGGTGQVGRALLRAFRAKGREVTLLSRGDSGPDVVRWDGAAAGEWVRVLDGADVVINLAGRSVNCRYTAANLDQMMRSRVDSTRAIGLAISRSARPPRVWLQMSTATIYAHRYDAPNDDVTGVIGGSEPDAPPDWRASIEIARAWEQALFESTTPSTRKVALRSAMVMTPDRGGIFDTLLELTKVGLGGPIAGGRQYMSWVHEDDFIAAIELLIANDGIEGPINIASPNPLPQRDFMKALRDAAGIKVGFPATKWMSTIGAFVLRTETELVLKSRRVTPKRLLDAGFVFRFANWRDAAEDLVKRART